MILLSKVRLINWYAFNNITVPVGRFTLIAGKNGNGKSVLLDAIKYAAFGDVVFNKSTDRTGSRTLSSYARGLLDATAGTYMRPADKYPNVYSHIVLEFFDDINKKFFILGTVIETNASNNCQSYRYVIDKAELESIEHTYNKEGVLFPCTRIELQKKYKLTLLNREEGLAKFTQMLGLRFTTSQLQAYVRKMRGIMSYDPNAKIDEFIRESVVEDKKVNFDKLIEAKKNIEQLKNNFDHVNREMSELNGIIDLYDKWEFEFKRIKIDDIHINYKQIKDLIALIEKEKIKSQQAKVRKEVLTSEIERIEKEKEFIAERLIAARNSLSELDCAKSIIAEEKSLEKLEANKKELVVKRQKLENFQNKVNELLNIFIEDNIVIGNKSQLIALCKNDYTVTEKALAVEELKKKVLSYYDDIVKNSTLIESKIKKLDDEILKQQKIIDDCKKHRSSYSDLADYEGLKNEINKEFSRLKINGGARLACEYVKSLKDEAWRDAIEAFLGARRYVLLVTPSFYDIADDVFNKSQYRKAHLFNTKLLMSKNIKVHDDSPALKLDIKNKVAQAYFNFQLGKMHGVKLEEVRKHENAISKEGRVSVAMDSYFLRFDRIRAYYLGQEIFELNAKRAEKTLELLNKTRQDFYADLDKLRQKKNIISEYKELFVDYDYEVHEKYQEILQQINKTCKRLEELRLSQANNDEFVALSKEVERLQKAKDDKAVLHNKKISEQNEQNNIINNSQQIIDNKSVQLIEQEKILNDYKINYYLLVKQTEKDYENFLQMQDNNRFVMTAATRERNERRVREAERMLIEKQAAYNTRYQSNFMTGTSNISEFIKRCDKIRIDDLEEISKKLSAQTDIYENIFKNEIVLTILKNCENTRRELRSINAKLSKLNFAAKYKFDVQYVKDDSDYAKILEYAEFLNERKDNDVNNNLQLSFGEMVGVDDKRGEELKLEIKNIISRVVESNSSEIIQRFADYRNYMTYELIINNDNLTNAKLSRQIGFNSGAEVQIPYMLILLSALLIIYDQSVNSSRLVFIDEPFVKMDPANIKLMLKFMRELNLQLVFCSPDKTESIGDECEVILPVLREKPDDMQIGIVKFH